MQAARGVHDIDSSTRQPRTSFHLLFWWHSTNCNFVLLLKFLYITCTSCFVSIQCKQEALLSLSTPILRSYVFTKSCLHCMHLTRVCIITSELTNSIVYETREFNATFTRAFWRLSVNSVTSYPGILVGLTLRVGVVSKHQIQRVRIRSPIESISCLRFFYFPNFFVCLTVNYMSENSDIQ